MRLAAIPAMLSMIPSVIRGVGLQDLERIKRIVRIAFPEVKQVDPQTLSDWLQEAPSKLLLVDVRSPTEYSVSHLKGAVNLHTSAEIREAIVERQPSRTILYCSVGYRSSQLAARLSGVDGQIYNLEGSIFDWANQGCPLFRGAEQVATVHPFSARWAGLLKTGLASKS